MKQRKFGRIILATFLTLLMYSAVSAAAQGAWTYEIEPSTPDMAQVIQDAANAGAPVYVHAGDYKALGTFQTLTVDHNVDIVLQPGDYSDLELLTTADVELSIEGRNGVASFTQTISSDCTGNAVYAADGVLTLNLGADNQLTILDYKQGLSVAGTAELHIVSGTYDIDATDRQEQQYIAVYGVAIEGEAAWFTTRDSALYINNMEKGIHRSGDNNPTSWKPMEFLPGSHIEITNAGQVGIYDYSAADTGAAEPMLMWKIDGATLILTGSLNGYSGGRPANRHTEITNSSIVASGNSGAGMKFDTSSLHITNASLLAENNGSFGFTGMTQATVKNSEITTKNNGMGGMVFYDHSTVQDSTLTSIGDGAQAAAGNRTQTAAVRVYPGSLTILDSVLNFDSGTGIVYMNSAAGNIVVTHTGKTVSAILGNTDFAPSASHLYDEISGGNTGRTIITGSSLQADWAEMTRSVTGIDSLTDLYRNPLIASAEQYSAPTNEDGTALSRFDLTAANAEVGAGKNQSFTYYDPNTGSQHTYTFRFTEAGEDIDKTLSGTAYVWTPVSVIHYDATEGTISSFGTAQQDDRSHATDITIYGNSLDLGERIMPVPTRSGYSFDGWYVSTLNGEIQLIDEEEDYKTYNELYALLNTKFTQTMKLVSNQTDPETGLGELTVYAKWSKNGSPGTTNPGTSKPDPEKPDPDAPEESEPEKPELPFAEDHFMYIVGYPDGTVRPEGNITRSEVATIFFRLIADEYREEVWSQQSGYPDVKLADWYHNAIATMTNAGVIYGYPDGSFGPDRSITRAEFAAVVARFVENQGYTPSLNAFRDTAGHWAEDYIGIAAALGWIEGYPDGTYRPDNFITRAETATLINRVLERLPQNESALHQDMVTWPDNADSSAWYYLAIQEATNSHEYERKADGVHEAWTGLRQNRNWTLLEQPNSTPQSIY